EAARRFGADVPVMRPIELAADETPGVEPVLHIVEWLERQERYRPDYVMLLQPTSPFRTAADIDAAVDLAGAHDAIAVVSVCESSQHPAWLQRLDDDGTLSSYLDAPGRAREQPRQALAAAYALNGAIYLTRRDVLLRGRSLYGARTYAYVMPQERSLDIDTP